MWTKIAGIILRNRIAFITGVLLGTVFMGFQARHIQMSYESADLLPKTDTAYLDYAKFRETFGQEGNIMVFAIQDSNFYDLAKINDWIAMGNNIKALKGVTALMSITHTFNLHKNTELKNSKYSLSFPIIFLQKQNWTASPSSLRICLFTTDYCLISKNTLII